MDKITISLKDVQLSQLNGECLRLVGKFTRELKARRGETLVMQDADILVKISERARKTRSKELKQIYTELKEAMIKSVHETMSNSERSWTGFGCLIFKFHGKAFVL